MMAALIMRSMPRIQLPNKPAHQTVALSAVLIDLDGGAPAEIKLLPDGAFRSARDDRPADVAAWVMNGEAAQAILAAQGNLHSRFLIDYDHQTLRSEQNGKPAPAAGWSGRLEWRDGDGLYATDLEWTEAALAAIASKEYRYISPVIRYNKTTGVVTYIPMAALVNYPAIDGLNDLAAAAAELFPLHEDIMATKLGDLLSRLMDEKEVTREQMGQAAGIDADTVSQILNGSIKRPPDERLRGFAKALGVSFDSLVNTLPTEDKSMATTAALNGELGLSDSATTDDVITAIAALKAKADAPPDPARFVPIDVFNELQGKLAALSGQSLDDRVEKLIEDAVNAGKVIGPKDKKWLTDLGKNDLAALQGALDSRQPLAALAGMQSEGKAPPAASDELTDAERKVCAQMQIDPAAFKQARA
jgi:phage I-like protein